MVMPQELFRLSGRSAAKSKKSPTGLFNLTYYVWRKNQS
jgi:hypothetical protein